MLMNPNYHDTSAEALSVQYYNPLDLMFGSLLTNIMAKPVNIQ
jgi:hypothetical protein